MKKSQAIRSTSSESFDQACRYWDAGDTSRALQMFQSLAAKGDSGAQLNLGYFYDEGIGVRRSEAKALYWYARSFRTGSSSGAKNIGIIYRDRGNRKRAIAWFLRAIKAGDDGAALEVAKLRVDNKNYSGHVKRYLERVATSDRATESENQEAQALLRRLESKRPTKKA